MSQKNIDYIIFCRQIPFHLYASYAETVSPLGAGGLESHLWGLAVGRSGSAVKVMKYRMKLYFSNRFLDSRAPARPLASGRFPHGSPEMYADHFA